jgi:hypothetical protein
MFEVVRDWNYAEAVISGESAFFIARGKIFFLKALSSSSSR